MTKSYHTCPECKDFLQIALNDSADYLRYLNWNKRKNG